MATESAAILRLLVLDSECHGDGTHPGLAEALAGYADKVALCITYSDAEMRLHSESWNAVLIHQRDDPEASFAVAAARQGMPVVVFSGALELAKDRLKVVGSTINKRVRLAALRVSEVVITLPECCREVSIEPLFFTLEDAVLTLLTAWYAMGLQWEMGIRLDWQDAGRSKIAGDRTMNQVIESVAQRGGACIRTALAELMEAGSSPIYYEKLGVARNQLLQVAEQQRAPNTP